jgi:hypothetical protein
MLGVALIAELPVVVPNAIIRAAIGHIPLRRSLAPANPSTGP